MSSGARKLGDTLVDEPRPPASSTIPTRIGRFVVLGLVGAGAMGVVYAAWDPKLGRRVALKLVPPGIAHTSAQKRLVREAQALARLAHPNVVSVFDVDVEQAGVWIAMEYVEGQTLARWLEVERRTWTDVLAVFRAAGEGLAAAHAANLVHRDFKPDNVLVGSDGRVRVADFGLVRTGEEPEADVGELARPSSPAPPSITRASALVGTPRYMAPEQFLRQGVDARSDQFAFCVALYEALHGVAPFGGESLRELARAVVRAQLRAPTHHPELPESIRRAVLRGLARDPSERFPDMRALLDALEVRPPWWPRALGLAGVVGGALALAFVLEPGERELVDPCGGPDVLEQVWPRARRDAVAERFVEIAPGYGSRSFASVDASITAWGASWSAAYVQTCQTRHEQSSAAYDLRMSCLGRQRDHVAAFVDVHASGDIDSIHVAPEQAAALPDPSVCFAADPSHAGEAPDAGVAERVAELRGTLAGVAARVEVERLVGVDVELAALRHAAEPLGYRPLLAEIARVEAELALRQDDRERARERLTHAFELAMATGHESLALDTATALIEVDVDCEHGPSLAIGQRWVLVARTLAQRFGDTPRLELARLAAHGDLLGVYARYDESRAELERAVELAARLYGRDDLRSAKVELALGQTLLEAGMLDEAAPVIDHVVAVYEASLGDQHPLLAIPLLVRAQVEGAAGRNDEARASGWRAVTIEQASFGPDHPDTLATRGSYANLLAEQGRLVEARRHFEDVLARSGDVDSRWAATTLFGLCSVEVALGDFMAAAPTCTRALAGMSHHFGAAHPVTAVTLNDLAAVARSEGDFEHALELDHRALEACAIGLGHEQLYCSYSHVGIGESLLALGRREDAREAARKALEIRASLVGVLALGELGEAECLVARIEGDPLRARSGLERMQATPERWGRQIAACTIWLRERG